MAVTVLAWNIERFGDRYGFGVPGAACDALRMALIAQVVRDAGAQVLVIQELRLSGLVDLPRLQNALNQTGNNDWHYDWIPGAVNDGAGIPPPGFASLDFQQRANSEGYAVLYRQGYLAALPGALSAGQDTSARQGGANPNFIDLVFTGQTLVVQRAEPRIQFDLPPPAQNTALNFPQTLCPDATLAMGTRKRRAVEPDTTIPLPYGTRRPCKVMVVDATAPAPQPGFPLMVYHAPSKTNGAYYGSLIALAADFIQTDGDRAFAGDLNIVSVPNRAYYRGWTEALGYPHQTYDTVNNAFYNTSVHPNVDRTTWHSGAGVLTDARDYGFSSGAVTVTIQDVLGLIQNAGSHTNTFLRGAATVAANRAATLNTVLPTRANSYPANANVAIAAYFDGTANYPPGADARTCAALIFNLLLSDHLPVCITRA